MSFSKVDISELYQDVISNMTENQLSIITEEYGDMGRFKEEFIASAGKEKAQGNVKK